MRKFAELTGAPALAPLHNPIYRNLWIVWSVANLTLWTHDVAAAWLMTSLTDSSVLIALVQTASTLPFFLLGVPSGAIADIVDRRRYFATTQLWVAITAVVLAVLAVAGVLNAPLLLLFTFFNGLGLAMRGPLFAAIVPEVVQREQFPAALALQGVSMNLSRIVGPVIAGAVIASLGIAAVFALNALLAGIAFWLVLRWRSQSTVSTLPAERFLGAMRIGLQHVRHSPRMRIVMLRMFPFFLQASALLALLPLIARHVHGGGAAMYTALLACMGVGAVVAALQMQWLRARFDGEQLVRYGITLHAGVSTLVVVVPEAWITFPAMALIGATWISTTNTLHMAAQMALPDWVRARGMSIYQTVALGGTAGGAALWGQVADVTSVATAVIVAALTGMLLLYATRRVSVASEADEDLTRQPPRSLSGAATKVAPGEGPVMIIIEYMIDPARADGFAGVMEATRRARLRQGSMTWGLFRDINVSGRYIEYFTDASWIEHLRRQERFTTADMSLHERRLAFHIGREPPRVDRYVAAASATE